MGWSTRSDGDLFNGGDGDEGVGRGSEAGDGEGVTHFELLKIEIGRTGS